jgi:hypothetical protein
VIKKMDAEEDYLGVPSMDTAGGSKGRCFTPLPQSATSSGPMDKAGDLGDMTFCMANYVKEAMQVSWVNFNFNKNNTLLFAVYGNVLLRKCAQSFCGMLQKFTSK